MRRVLDVQRNTSERETCVILFLLGLTAGEPVTPGQPVLRRCSAVPTSGASSTPQSDTVWRRTGLTSSSRCFSPTINGSPPKAPFVRVHIRLTLPQWNMCTKRLDSIQGCFSFKSLLLDLVLLQGPCFELSS